MDAIGTHKGFEGHGQKGERKTKKLNFIFTTEWTMRTCYYVETQK